MLIKTLILPDVSSSNKILLDPILKKTEGLICCVCWGKNKTKTNNQSLSPGQQKGKSSTSPGIGSIPVKSDRKTQHGIQVNLILNDLLSGCSDNEDNMHLTIWKCKVFF